jgi:hypothetical protein
MNTIRRNMILLANSEVVIVRYACALLKHDVSKTKWIKGLIPSIMYGCTTNQ